MDNTQILMAMVGGLGCLMLWVWKNVDKRFDKVDNRFDKLDEKVTDIDRRLCRLEGAFNAKDCCVIKDHCHKSDAG